MNCLKYILKVFFYDEDDFILDTSSVADCRTVEVS